MDTEEVPRASNVRRAAPLPAKAYLTFPNWVGGAFRRVRLALACRTEPLFAMIILLHELYKRLQEHFHGALFWSCGNAATHNGLKSKRFYRYRPTPGLAAEAAFVPFRFHLCGKLAHRRRNAGNAAVRPCCVPARPDGSAQPTQTWRTWPRALRVGRAAAHLANPTLRSISCPLHPLATLLGGATASKPGSLWHIAADGPLRQLRFIDKGISPFRFGFGFGVGFAFAVLAHVFGAVIFIRRGALLEFLGAASVATNGLFVALGKKPPPASTLADSVQRSGGLHLQYLNDRDRWRYCAQVSSCYRRGDSRMCGPWVW